jgi:hypothetical protein
MQELRIKSSSKIVMVIPVTPSCSRKFKRNCELSLLRTTVIITDIVNYGF